jgi:4-hydroxy-tetrahydrodipicolinate synthase
VKEAMGIRGYSEPHLRLPLTRLSEEHVAELERILDELEQERVAAEADQ